MATAKKTTPKKAAEADEKPAKKSVKKAEAAEPEVKKPAARAKKAAEEAPAKKPAKKAVEAEAPAAVEAAVAVEAPKAAPKKAAKPAEAGLSAHAATILEALREGRALEFIFADAEANAPRTFEPRQLIFDTLAQAWFVWGWDRRYNAERFHRLDLLSEVNAVEGAGRSAQGPYKEGTPSNQIGGWLGGEAIAVKVLLHKQWVFAVKQAPPAFPEFKLEEVEEGKAQVSFTATDLRAIARWCLQFGDGITVQEPARLLDRMRQVAAAWGVKGAPAPAPAPTKAPARAEHKPEHKSEHRSEHKPEHRSEQREPSESHRHRERKENREREPREESRSSNPKVEIRFDRL